MLTITVYKRYNLLREYLPSTLVPQEATTNFVKATISVQLNI